MLQFVVREMLVAEYASEMLHGALALGRRGPRNQENSNETTKHIHTPSVWWKMKQVCDADGTIWSHLRQIKGRKKSVSFACQCHWTTTFIYERMDVSVHLSNETHRDEGSTWISHLESANGVCSIHVLLARKTQLENTIITCTVYTLKLLLRSSCTRSRLHSQWKGSDFHSFI